MRSLYDSDEFKKAKVEHDDIVKKISVVYGENFEFRHVQCAYQAVVAQVRGHTPFGACYFQLITICT